MRLFERKYHNTTDGIIEADLPKLGKKNEKNNEYFVYSPKQKQPDDMK